MNLFYLKIKTQKVQSFIFKVPKLKAMLGANSLLGEFFAKDLPELRANDKNSIPECWRDYNFPKDLLKWENDDIYENFKNGVICSAGGHFETFFKTQPQANEFVENVKRNAQAKIPGVNLSFFLKKYDTLPKYFKKFDENGEVIELPKETSEILIDNPYFYPSDQDGENPQLIRGYKNASGKIEKDSKVTKHIKEAGDKFYEGSSKDYLCQFLKDITKEDNNEVKFSNVFENNLEELAKLSLIPKNNKIAIIAIDGNAMGNRFRDKLNEAKGKLEDGSDGLETISALIDFEKYWFDQRKAFRDALKSALLTISDCPYKNKRGYWKYPFQILMLGGDDLLIVTVPEIAFDLVKDFGYEISKDKEKKLSVATGIAFVKYSFPFSQAHELAESLLSSAKVKSRIWEKAKNKNGKEMTKTTYRNTLDWHVHFPTGTEDIDEIRKNNYFLKYNDKYEILTQRPCTMKDAMKVWDNSKKLFDSINDKEEDNYENSFGRNKYKGLRTLLKTGQRNVELFTKILDLDKQKEDHFHLDIKYQPEKDKDGKTKENSINWKKGNNDKKIEYDKITINTAFDVIELMDFHKREEEKESKK